MFTWLEIAEKLCRQAVLAGKKIMQIIDLTKIPFIKDAGATAEASKEMVAWYD